MATKTKKKPTRKASSAKRSKLPAASNTKRRNIIISIAVALVLIAVGIYLVATHAATNYTVFVGPGGKCLDNDHQKMVNGNKIQLWSCNNTAAQQWHVNTDGTITNANGYCLDVAGVAEKSLVVLHECNAGDTQKWKVDATNDTIVHVASNFCLDDRGIGTTDGNTIWLYVCNGTAAQKWDGRDNGDQQDDPSGVNAPVGDLSGWKQVFIDNFGDEKVNVGGFSGCTTSGMTCPGLPSAVRSKWWAYPDGWQDTTGHGQYWPSKTMSIRDGVMNVHVYTSGGIHRVAAPVPRIKGVSGYGSGMKYGRYSVRFKADSMKGYKTAWLLWPDSTVQKGGEIDFPEGNLNDTISAFMHPPVRDDQDAFNTSARYTSWHTATLEWRPDSVTFILDGKTIGKSTSAHKRIPATPMQWILQSETQTYPTTAAPSSSVSGNIQIDWVAAWSYKP